MSSPEDVIEAQRRLWALGDYGAVARHLRPISEALVAAVGVGPGQRVLDVAVGDGNTALAALDAGASDVVGVDLCPEQLDLARARLALEGADVALHEANAEALPFPDGGFDVVLSALGVIFAPDQAAATAELARVCRPGGRVGLATWAGGGWSDRLWEGAGDLLPAREGGPRPDAWGDPDVVCARLAEAGIEARAEERAFHWAFPSVPEALAFFRASSSPFLAAFALAEQVGTADELARRFEQALAEVDEGRDGACLFPSPFLVVVGERA